MMQAKSNTMKEMPTVYDPAETERRIYQYWLSGGFFHAGVKRDKKPFSLVIPPPNVTGSLHLGHALDNTLQDIFVRFRRMQGYNVVWIPGTDHAGIATQVKVEKELAKEGLTRYDLGREKFLERVWAWKEKYGHEIIGQLQRLGTSCDWARERFTMDEGCSRAVREVFVRLFEKGLIYRGAYIINWCPRCNTSLSDLEVEHKEVEGTLYYVRYPLRDGDGAITVATTRPETMLGDVAVAVNPEDSRYSALVGRKVVLPIMGREIPVIADPYADPEFGTGAVKVTPAHDPNDFEVGERHGLAGIRVIGEDGRMTEAAGELKGLDRYECREKVVKLLEEGGLLVKTEPISHAIGHCQRCETPVEPLLSRQWFVRMKPLAEPAVRAVREGRIRFIPERFEKIYINWMEDVHDWCISRQLWWGHRIPVWYCDSCGKAIAAREEPGECPGCGGNKLTQDPDVLDTWFSSALWPFSTLGWPDRTPELEHFYPTSLLVTAYDIIFFWVARMIFMGLEFMGDVPFRDVFLHGLVRNPQWKKMSKSLGTGVDPIGIIDEYGADALRFTLVTGNTPGNDMRFYEERVEAGRNFANKIWNASRFAIMNLMDDEAPGDSRHAAVGSDITWNLEDRWILARCDAVIAQVTAYLDSYQVGEALRLVYDFAWSELCDWYIEIIKPRLYGRCGKESRAAAQVTLREVMTATLKLLHPFMPHLTEAIWQALPGVHGSIMVSEWPVPGGRDANTGAVEIMTALMEVIKAIRNLRAEVNIPPQEKVGVLIRGPEYRTKMISTHGDLVRHLANIGKITFGGEGAEKPGKAIAAVAAGVEIYLPLAGLVDIEREIERLRKGLDELDGELEGVRKKLSNEGFLTRAPAEIVEKERAREAEYSDKRERLVRRLEELGG